MNAFSSPPSRWLCVGFAALALLASESGLRLRAESAALFGPKDIVRTTSSPDLERFTFTQSTPHATGDTLCIDNGGVNDGYDPVTSARVTLNGAELFGPSDFKKKVTTLGKTVVLRMANEITATLAGKPGSGISIWIASGPNAPCAAPPTSNPPPQNHAPAITSTPIAFATLRQAYAYPVTAVDTENDPLVYALTTKPSGMTINPSTGLIAWTPLGTGTVNVEVSVSDGRGGVTPQPFTVTVAAPQNRAPQLVAVRERTIPLGSKFRTRLLADDPDPQDTLSFSLVSAPSGATLSPDPFVEWTPGVSQLGPHTFIASVHDAAGLADTKSFVVTVVDAPVAPAIDPQSDSTISQGAPYSRAITAHDANADALTFALVSGPAGLTVSAGGTLNWAPGTSQLGAQLVKVKVSDPGGLADAAIFTLTVEVPSTSHAPVAVDDRFAVRKGTTLVVPAAGVLANDSDADGQALISQGTSTTTKGALTLGASGGFTYVPTAPPANSTQPVLKFSYSRPDLGTSFLGNWSQPVVADLDRDGKPEIVVLGAGLFTIRRLEAVHGDTGARAWSINAYDPTGTPALAIDLASEVTIADLDGDGYPEILTVNDAPQLRRTIVAFNHDGTYRWTSDDIVNTTNVTESSGFQKIAVADLNGDGQPEILVGYVGKGPLTPAGTSSEDYVSAFDRAGHLLFTARGAGRSTQNPSPGNLSVADLDLDGTPEIIFSDDVYSNTGVLRWSASASIGIGIVDVAVANLDADPFAEIVYLDGFGQLYVYEHTGARKWGPIDQVSLSTLGLLTIADIDGDGQPEIILPGNDIVARNADGTIKRVFDIPAPYDGWGGVTTVFDLNGDGKPEVIHNGGTGPFDTGFKKGAIYIFDGSTGTLLNTIDAGRDAGNDHRGPIVADVDGDGTAEIIAGGWNEAIMLRVFRAANGNWARTRPLWTSSLYHVTDIDTTLKVPAHALINWLTPGLNNFRVNTLLPAERVDDVDEFTYVASDGALSSNVARVRLDLLPSNNAPHILSTAGAAAAPGIEYVYGVRAVDIDPGETLSFALSLGPAGMTINSATGIVRWTPAAAALGTTVSAAVRVTDSQGQSDAQQFFITVSAAVTVPSLIGKTTAEAMTALNVAGLLAGVQTPVPAAAPIGQVVGQEPGAGQQAAQGAAIALSISSGPAPNVVPNVVGKKQNAANAALVFAGFTAQVTRVFSSTTPEGYVQSQSPQAGALSVPGPVAITVSAGTGLSLRLRKSVTTADAAIPFVVASYDLAYAESSAGTVSYSITPIVSGNAGPLPSVVGSAIVPAITTRGAFRITATDGSGRTASAEFAVVYPREPAGKASMMATYAALTEAMSDIDELARHGRVAGAAGDVVLVRSLLSAMVTRWKQVDLKALRLATPFGLEHGFFPGASDLPSFGLTPTPDDLVAQQVLKDANADLQSWIDGLRAPLTSISDLRARADLFNSRIGRFSALTLSEWGVIKGQSAMTALMSDRLPALYDALMSEVEKAIASAPLPEPNSEDGPFVGDDSKLAELIVTQVMDMIVEEIMDNAVKALANAKQFAKDIMKQAAFGAAIVASAHHIKDFVQGKDLTAVIAGASMSFHLFGAPWSIIEADIDTDEPGNNVLVTIGPDLMEAVIGVVDNIKNVTKFGETLDPNSPGDDGRAKNANDIFDALGALKDALNELLGSVENVSAAIKNAFQDSGELFKGCLFSASPTCGEVIYPDGLRSVYEYTPPFEFRESFTGLPVPILFMMYNRNTGAIFIDTPVFFPTKKEGN